MAVTQWIQVKVLNYATKWYTHYTVHESIYKFIYLLVYIHRVKYTISTYSEANLNLKNIKYRNKLFCTSEFAKK